MQETRICQNCHQEFVIEPDDFSFYEKMQVPAPTWCPECRMKRKLIWRNEQTFYKRVCDLCNKSIISIYHPRYSAPVYCFDCHTSDKWDPYSYGIAYNLEKPFFDQFRELLVRVPKGATHIGTGSGQNVNSEYVNFAGGNKNCYLIFNSAQNEDSSYSRGIVKSRDVMDMYFADQAERCYEGVNVNRCNGVLWSQNAVNCLDSYFLLGCTDLQNCFGCVNLRHKSFCFFNEQLEEIEWKKRVGEIMGSYEKIEEIKKKFHDFAVPFPHKEHNNLKSPGCSGDYIFESKNCISCFEAFMSEDCKWSSYIKFLKDSYDVVGRGYQSELLLETVAVGSNCSRVLGSWSVEVSHDVEYSYDLRACSYCLGCVGLKHGEYSILNKKYSEKEYRDLHGKIKLELKKSGIWGSFFPENLSPWAYNETLAQDSYPLGKNDALTRGFRWEEDIPRTKGKETLFPEKIPDTIQNVDDLILDEMLRCGTCGYNYRLVPSELAFYKRMNIPVPRMCFGCRHANRVKQRGDFKLYHRECVKCGKSIETTYAPDRPEIVYCEACYQAEVV